MECFTKIVDSYNCFSKALYLRSLTGFWVALLSLSTHAMYCMRHIQNSAYYRKFKHIQPHFGIFWTLCYSSIFRPLVYLESGIFRTRDIFKILSRHILAYLKHRVAPAYWEHWNIQSFSILACLRLETYSEAYWFRRIQVYSIMIVVIILTFFFHFNLRYFWTKI